MKIIDYFCRFIFSSKFSYLKREETRGLFWNRGEPKSVSAMKPLYTDFYARNHAGSMSQCVKCNYRRYFAWILLCVSPFLWYFNKRDYANAFN